MVYGFCKKIKFCKKFWNFQSILFGNENCLQDVNDESEDVFFAEARLSIIFKFHKFMPSQVSIND